MAMEPSCHKVSHLDRVFSDITIFIPFKNMGQTSCAWFSLHDSVSMIGFALMVHETNVNVSLPEYGLDSTCMFQHVCSATLRHSCVCLASLWLCGVRLRLPAIIEWRCDHVCCMGLRNLSLTKRAHDMPLGSVGKTVDGS